ncbi:hypothetical protein EHQ68_14135 [Leptospira congkakensis]|uniref:Uncharacterized protein n=1 Tax=Leptospira congkakensis TaxID=2484932 RepID=A0A4Z1A6D4_9LEPT|nr:hypothetical protein [Leptospira congkakensis]TGL86455.1 hypothetical protein EHQ68_14135 [Leptospira congkakensis]TGL93999.1 hypothetical protein EHQ69_05895 [Leptospira congkakensis]TGL94595.1 hypothetical protein EHQ70_14900 [Leptospira congkakensis]
MKQLIKPIITILLLAVLNINCKAQRDNKIQETKNKCLETMYLASLNAGKPGFSGTFQFLGSCSGTSNYSPSCIEQYAVVKEEIVCPLGYTKSSVKCSVQNLVGVCRYQPNGDTTKVTTVVYAKPNDTSDTAIANCQSYGVGSIFTETYLNPGDRSTSLDSILTTAFVCIDKAEKN